jgi:hypothetical protein
MKKYTMVAMVASLFWLSSAQAQDLELACNSDMVLSMYLASELGAGQNAIAGSLSTAEISEIQSVLADPPVVDGSAQEKFKAVMAACSQGEILNNRFSPSSN